MKAKIQKQARCPKCGQWQRKRRTHKLSALLDDLNYILAKNNAIADIEVASYGDTGKITIELGRNYFRIPFKENLS